MASTINATTTGSGGLITTGNSVNQLELQTGDTTRLVIDGSGNVTIQGQGDLRMADSDSSHYVALQAPGTVSSNVTFTLPGTDGTNGQVLQTNGSGVLSFTTIATSTPLSIATTTTVAAAATTTINCALGSVFNITLGTSITTLSFTNVPASPQATQLQLVFKKDTSVNQYTIAWPASVYWENNTTPNSNLNPNSVITVTLTTIDGGTKWRGSFQTIEGYAAQLWGWGLNNTPRIGDGTALDRSSPIQIGSLSTWVSVGYWGASTGGTFAVTNDGVVYAAGDAAANQFGNMKADILTVQSNMVPSASGLKAFMVSGTGTAQIAIGLDGKLWGWGRGSELGLRYSNGVSQPIIVNSGTWIDCDMSLEAAYALRSDGTLWYTGRAAEGQSGRGNVTPQSVWAQIGSDTTWTSVVTGTDTQNHVLAIKYDGTLWSWGYNAQGQLGLGNTVNRSSPVQIGSGTNWVQASASYLSSAAIKSDGTLWTWGYGAGGILGLGDILDRSSPVQVGALTDWKQVCVSLENMYAIKTDGTLWSWGTNNYGQLGTNNTTNRSSPVQVGAATDWLWLPKKAVGYWIHCIRGTATNP